jgi:hypothetical protein
MNDLMLDNLLELNRLALANRIAIVLIAADKPFTDGHILAAYKALTKGKRRDPDAELELFDAVRSIELAIDAVQHGDGS